MSCVGGQGQVCIEIMESCKIVYKYVDLKIVYFLKFVKLFVLLNKIV